MKTIKKFFIALASVLGLASCSQFLEDAPRTSVTDGVSFTTEASLEAQVNALYVKVCNLYGAGSVAQYFMSCAKDVCFRGNRRGSLEYDQVQDLAMYSKSSSNQNVYNHCFGGINYANTLIDGLASSPVDEAYKTEIEAEARFFRAFNYFYAVRLYGNLAIFTKHPTTTEEACRTREPYYDVYKFILDDLEFAEKNMRSRERQEEVNPGLSRCYKEVATFVKALVYMQIASYYKAEEENPGKEEIPIGTKRTGVMKIDFSNCGFTNAHDAWQACLDACNEVINSGVYALEPDYRHLFLWDSRRHPEYYQSRERMFVICVTNESATANSAAYCTPDYYVFYDGSYPTIHNGSQGMVHGQRWIWEEWGKKYGGVYAKKTSTHDWNDGQGKISREYQLMQLSKDPREDATYIHHTYQIFDLGGTNTIVSKNAYPNSGFGTNYSVAADGTATLSTSDGGFWLKKYHSLTYTGNGTGDADVYIHRFSEVYLTAAEAAANLGKLQDAIDYVNVVLTRARKSVDPGQPESEEPANWQLADYPDEPTLTKAIAWEKEFESVGEAPHWMDQHRHGITWLSNWMADLNVFINKRENGNHKEQFYYGKDVPTDYEYLKGSMFCAFPDYELRYNTSLDGELDQNVYIHQ